MGVIRPRGRAGQGRWRQGGVWSLLFAWLWIAPAAAAECPVPAPMTFELTGKITRSALGFTQGLEFRDGQLYESTGLVDGSTQVNTISLTGQVTTLVDLGQKVFGEGLTIFNDQIVQLTWQDHAVFAYDLRGRLLREMHNPREGWGLTNDGRRLIFSDGGPSVYFADPRSFAITGAVKIRTDKPGDVQGLNELELVDGKLYGNIFTSRLIIRIDPASGCVEAVADMARLWDAMDADERKRLESSSQYVLNGIAHDRATGLFYLTGKRWKSIFTGRFSEVR